MANYCSFKMKVGGDEKAIKELNDMLARQGDYQNNGLGVVFRYASEMVREREAEGLGACAWSVGSAMVYRGENERSLLEATERLGLAVEIFSQEPMNGLQEHFIIDHGNVVTEEQSTFIYEVLIAPEQITDADLKPMSDFTGFSIGEIRENIRQNDAAFVYGLEPNCAFSDLVALPGFSHEHFSKQHTTDESLSSLTKEAGMRAAEKNATRAFDSERKQFELEQ